MHYKNSPIDLYWKNEFGASGPPEDQYYHAGSEGEEEKEEEEGEEGGEGERKKAVPTQVMECNAIM